MSKPRQTQAENLTSFHPRDLFQTPNYATDLLVPFIPKDVTHIWECAAGERKIADRLMYHGYSVAASDVRELPNVVKLNFLSDVYNWKAFYQWELNDYGLPRGRVAIVTNPPYSLAKKFYQKCLEIGLAFALLVNADYCLWKIDAIRDGCEKIIPDHRIDFITPTGKSGATGHTSYFHSMWLTRGFNIGRTETFVRLTREMKKNI